MCIRDRYYMVQRGHGPAEQQSGRLARLQTALLARQTQRENSRREWTENWWATELLTHEWLPNEQAVRFRGQGYGFVHQHVYKPLAAGAGIRPLSKRWWRECAKSGLHQLHEQGKLQGSDMTKLRVKRSANHSNMPECTKCHDLRKDYHAAVKVRGADPAVVDQKYQALLDHNEEWSSDRKAALRLKYGTYHQQANDCYEYDDGCGSFWQALPVDPTGCDSKKSVTAKY